MLTALTRNDVLNTSDAKTKSMLAVEHKKPIIEARSGQQTANNMHAIPGQEKHQRASITGSVNCEFRLGQT